MSHAEEFQMSQYTGTSATLKKMAYTLRSLSVGCPAPLPSKEDKTETEKVTWWRNLTNHDLGQVIKVNTSSGKSQ